jgi:hypothetical protein
MRPTPLLDFFKRGEVDRDARLLAAQGGLGTGPLEQLGILVHLLEDADREIRETADETLERIPTEAIEAFLGRSDVPVSLREFFADRGVFPAETPAIEVEEEAPLVTNPMLSDDEEEVDDNESRDTALQKLQKMGFTQRLKAAVKGSREMRAILVRDPNKMISAAVLSSPKLSQPEVEAFAKMQNISEDVLRIISNNRAWLKNYSIIFALAKNPKTPVATSINFMARLTAKDVAMLSVDRNVPEAVRAAARKKAAVNRGGSG